MTDDLSPEPLEPRITEFLIERGVPAAKDVEVDLSLDSYITVQLIVFMESEFGLSFYPEDIVPDHFRDVRSIARFVREKLARGGAGR